MSNQLTQEEQNKLFKEIADKHIDLANTQLHASGIHLSSTGLLYGAARFTAFTVASTAENKKEYEASLDDAVAHYGNLFKSMLEENLESYKSAFKEEPRYAHLVKDNQNKS